MGHDVAATLFGRGSGRFFWLVRESLPNIIATKKPNWFVFQEILGKRLAA
jgi:hypothetical protein